MRNIVLNILTTCIEKGDVVVLLGCACAWCSIIEIRHWVHTTETLTIPPFKQLLLPHPLMKQARGWWKDHVLIY